MTRKDRLLLSFPTRFADYGDSKDVYDQHPEVSGPHGTGQHHSPAYFLQVRVYGALHNRAFLCKQLQSL
jgi:hypothetical protein